MILDINKTISSGISRKFGRKESCTQEHLYRRFSSSGHMGFFKDASVTSWTKRMDHPVENRKTTEWRPSKP